VTISTQQKIQPSPTNQSVRLGPASSRMTLMPATPLQTVSLAPTSHINVPMAPNVLTSNKTGLGLSQRLPAKLISVPGTATSGPPSATPPGVTIQKTSIPVSQQHNIQQQQPRTISLPYGATQVAAISKPINQSIPVARVCPQPLSSTTGAGPNLVTITSTVGGMTQGQQGSVYIARAASSLNQQGMAINLTNNQTLNLSKTKINLPTQPARLVNLPTQPNTSQFQQQQQHQHQQHQLQQQQQQQQQHQQQQQQQQLQQQQQQQQQQHEWENLGKLVPSSPRPSILRRREGERDNSMQGKINALAHFLTMQCDTTPCRPG
jgi:hypothetical protein